MKPRTLFFFGWLLTVLGVTGMVYVFTPKHDRVSTVYPEEFKMVVIDQITGREVAMDCFVVDTGRELQVSLEVVKGNFQMYDCTRTNGDGDG